MLAANGMPAYTARHMEFKHPALQGKTLELSSNEEEPLVAAPTQVPEEHYVDEILHETIEALDISADFEELADTLGHRYDVSINYPLTTNAYYNRHRQDPRAHIPGPIRLGSQIIDIAQDRPFAGSNIVGVKGKILRYRTQQAEDSTDTPTYLQFHSPDLYHEAGFFCLALAQRDNQTGKIVPGVVFGDLDHARWRDQGAKLGVIRLLCGDEIIEKLRTQKDTAERWHNLERSLFGISSSPWKRTLDYGVFLQNGEVFVNDSLSVYTQKAQMRDAMQTFIDNHAVPEQIFTGDEVLSKPNPDLLQKHFMPIALREPGLLLPWKNYQAQDEHLDLPLVNAVLHATSAHDRIYSSIGLHGLDRPLQKLLRTVPHSQLLQAFERDSLTDDETRMVHDCFEKTLIGNINGRSKVLLSLVWEHALKEYAHLYPELTKEKILAEGEKELKTTYKVPRELPA